MEPEEKDPIIIMDPESIEDGKMIAIISYLTVIGLIIAILLNNDKKNPFAFLHIRQSLGIWVAGLVLGLVALIPFLGWLIFIVGSILIFVMWVVGLFNAFNGKAKPVPVLGKYFEEWFSSIR